MNTRVIRRCVLFLVVLGAPAFGQTAGMLSFQGLIKDAGGVPVTGPVDLEFRIYDAQVAGGLVDMNGDGFVEDIIGQDAKQILGVSPALGIITTTFGPVAPAAFDGAQRWLEVRVDGAPLSRIEMATAPATAEQVNIPASGVSAINVDDVGNVGIGTSVPAAKLHVVGDIAISGNVDGVDVSAHAANANAHHTPTVDTFVSNRDSHDHLGGDGAQIQHGSLGGVTANQHHSRPTSLPPTGVALGDLTGSYPGPQVIDDSHFHSNGTVSDNISINNGRLYALAGSGNVGIGTTAPASKLTVETGGTTVATLRVKGSGSQILLTRNVGGTEAIGLDFNTGVVGLSPQWGGFSIQSRDTTTSATFFRNLVTFDASPGGGVYFRPGGNVTSPNPLVVGTNALNGNGAFLSPGGIWTNTSDRNTKKHFQIIDKKQVLEKLVSMPITKWQYKGQDNQSEHIGPMAQDFYATFGIGDDDKHIGTLDSDGVSLAAIQGLHEIVQEKEAEIAAQRAVINDLLDRIEAIEGMLGCD